MPIDPKPGLVIRYDFLWKADQRSGRTSGKDRPSAIVFATAERSDGSNDVLLCAIRHAPPLEGQTAVRLPEAVARHLGLDDRPSWIKTDEVNRVRWPRGRVPLGVSPVRKGQWSYGMIPEALGRAVFEQVRAKAFDRSLRTIPRDDG